jgi:P27 family predicted phage terminase small subunit
MRGRKPVPTPLKELRGNPGKRRVGSDPPFAKGMPSCPEHLDQTAKTEWRRVVKELHAAGILARVDRAMLAAYCQVYSRWVTFEKIVQAGPVLITGEQITDPQTGKVLSDTRQFTANPCLRAMNQILRQLHAFASEFGMSPASRVRLQSPGAGEAPKNKLQLFIQDAG